MSVKKTLCISSYSSLTILLCSFLLCQFSVFKEWQENERPPLSPTPKISHLMIIELKEFFFFSFGICVAARALHIAVIGREEEEI